MFVGRSDTQIYLQTHVHAVYVYVCPDTYMRNYIQNVKQTDILKWWWWEQGHYNDDDKNNNNYK